MQIIPHNTNLKTREEGNIPSSRVYKKIIFILLIVFLSISILSCSKGSDNSNIEFIPIPSRGNFLVPESAIKINSTIGELIYELSAQHRIVTKEYILKLLDDGWTISKQTGKTFFLKKNDHKYLLIIEKTNNKNIIKITIKSTNKKFNFESEFTDDHAVRLFHVQVL